MEITNVGTSQVSKEKLIIQMNNYENFNIKGIESIQDIFPRFMDILN